jgi:alkylhydroperoxidase family enzyme
MKPMFLRDVENYSEPSPYLTAIDGLRRMGREYPQIWHMFGFKAQATQHLAKFTQEIMREEAPLTPGLRELIAAFTSRRNDCPF